MRSNNYKLHFHLAVIQMSWVRISIGKLKGSEDLSIQE